MNPDKIPEKMKAAVFEGDGQLEIKQVPVPAVKKPDDVLIKVEACGICGTDIHICAIPQRHEAKEGVILGHEYIGKVIEVGMNVKNFRLGDRVVPNSSTPCGCCEYCDSEWPNLCNDLIRLGVYDHGGFAEYSLLPERALFKVSKTLSKELGTLVEPIACIMNTLKKMCSIIGKSVVILGGGPMGQLFLQLVKKSGAGVVILSEISEQRLKLGKKNGADFIINPEEKNIEEFIKEKNIGKADIVIDAEGSLFEQALSIANKGGIIAIFGNNNKAVAKFKPSDILLNEFNIITGFGVKSTYADTIKIVESGLIDAKTIITRSIPLDKLNEGLELLKTPKELKIIVDMQ